MTATAMMDPEDWKQEVELGKLQGLPPKKARDKAWSEEKKRRRRQNENLIHPGDVASVGNTPDPRSFGLFQIVEPFLTPRQFRILKLWLAIQRTDAQIAEELGISIPTVERERATIQKVLEEKKEEIRKHL